MTGFLLFFARIPVLVLALVTGVGAIGSSALTVQAYSATQSTSQAQYAQAQSAVQAKMDAVAAQQAALELAISNAKSVLESSSGKTPDESTRAALNAMISEAQQALELAKAQLAEAKAELQAAQQATSGFVFPWQVSAIAQDLLAAPLPVDTDLAQSVSSIGAKMKAVNDAQAAWQAEQDRAAAAAAAAAAARAAAARAAAARSLADSGGATTSTAPAPPATAQAAAPVSPNFSAENYIAAIAPNAYVVWVANMCANQYPGQNVYLCGYATVTQGQPNTARVPITLDSTLASRYSNSIGVSVLVHESAHARQFFKYGWAMKPANSTAPANLTGQQPVEFMAECATINKLGYGTGTYIGTGPGAFASSCTSAQLAEASLLWR